ncbi:hypothetical protein GGI21_006219, partial [Coemansia aciculifera]
MPASSESLAVAGPRRGTASMPARARSARHRHGSPAASASSTNRRRLLARAIHSNSGRDLTRNGGSIASLPFSPSTAADDTWEVPVYSASSDALWLFADNGFGKVGRSASCCEPEAAARRKSLMKRPSSCASEADYFNAAVAASESHASGKRTSLYRTSSLSSLLGGGDNNELADDALVPEALGDYRNKLVRLLTMPALSLSALAGDLAESDGVATRCDLTQSAGEAVEAQAPPPRPQFLRRL